MTRDRKAIIVLAKSAFAAAPVTEVSGYCGRLAQTADIDRVCYAFSEQGSPSLMSVLEELGTDRIAEITILPLLLPMEPNYRNWIKTSVQRWAVQTDLDDLPVIKVGQAPGEVSDMADVLSAMYFRAEAAENVLARAVKIPDASVIPDQQYRVLVCAGGACDDAGAMTLWGHLRNTQKDRKLRETAPGMMSCKTTCLGPCNLAPVIQVWPSGAYYCGVDETAIDRIIDEHVLAGQIVTDFSYAPAKGKQRLRG